jgi:hypothetical protein
MAVYFINPQVAWNGSLDIRKAEAAKSPTPLLRLVGGKMRKAAKPALTVVPGPNPT